MGTRKPYIHRPDPFTVIVDCSGLGYGKLKLPDLSRAQTTEIGKAAKRFDNDRLRQTALYISRYVSEIQGAEKSIPEAGANLNAWLEWLKEAPNRVVNRIEEGINTLLTDEGEDEDLGNSWEESLEPSSSEKSPQKTADTGI